VRTQHGATDGGRWTEVDGEVAHECSLRAQPAHECCVLPRGFARRAAAGSGRARASADAESGAACAAVGAAFRVDDARGVLRRFEPSTAAECGAAAERTFAARIADTAALDAQPKSGWADARWHRDRDLGCRSLKARQALSARGQREAVWLRARCRRSKPRALAALPPCRRCRLK
jgi:hypothetical protein